MTHRDQLALGIIGACGRGAAFARACRDSGRLAVRAICDLDESRLAESARSLGAEQTYTDYRRMLDVAGLDAVVVATPMPLHVEQSIAALQRGLHVLCEVPVAVSVEQCRELVHAADRSTGRFMMAENYTHLKHNTMVREMVRRGMFGRTYYGEGEYLHELSAYNPAGGWRRRWQTGINGVTYPTHSLGPLLQWMPGDRVVSVSCAGSGRHHRDDAGQLFENESSCVMLCRMRSGGLVKVRLDMLSHRPHAMNNYQLQGETGCYESARAQGERHRVWLADRCETEQWLDLDEPSLTDEFLPEPWQRAEAAGGFHGHEGGDYFALLEFIEMALDGKPPAVGLHEAMDMTLPGLISQQSIEQDSHWLAVPDSRRWLDPVPDATQLRMTWPDPAAHQPDALPAPEGYRLRQMTDDDESGCLELMDRAGFTHWSRSGFRAMRRSIIPGGAFLVEHTPSGRPVATAFAQHAPHDAHPHGGQLGWVTADPDHRGRRLGTVACAAATRRLIDAGYEDVYLLTDDFRLAAIKTYLRLGWQPVTHGSDMARRWASVREQLGMV